MIFNRSRGEHEPFHSQQIGHVQACLRLNLQLIHNQCQRCAVVAGRHETCAQLTNKVHIEHFVALSVQLLQSLPQQRYSILDLALKHQQLTSLTNRQSPVRYQGVGGGEVGHLRDALRRPLSVSRSKEHRKNQHESPAQYRQAAEFPSFVCSQVCVVQRLIKQSSVQQTPCHTGEREAGVIEQVQSCAEARACARVAKTGFEMFLRDKMISGQVAGSPQH